MARELAIPVGVMAECRQPATRWGDPYWIPVGVMPRPSRHRCGDVLYKSDTVTRYYMGTALVSCHAVETEAYIHNFESRVPALYVVLRRQTDDNGLPWYVHAVTASPYEAYDYQDSTEDIVERVEMPAEIAEQIMSMVDEYHRQEPFVKRKRVKDKPEEVKFGKEPIFNHRLAGGRGKTNG